jgi:hypothetical protein
MKTLEATILDPFHLELAEPLSVNPGERIRIVVPDEEDGDDPWHHASKRRLLEAYDAADGIYDEL